MNYYYKDRKEFSKDSLKEKIDRLLLIGKNDCEEYLEKYAKLKDISPNEVKERNIQIGALLKGEAFFHELDEYYDVIGFMVEAEHDYDGKRKTEYGFRGILFGKSSQFAPINFDEAYSIDDTGQIGNGLGDHIEILEELESKENVNKCIVENNIDINKYLKETNMYLEPKEENLTL